MSDTGSTTSSRAAKTDAEKAAKDEARERRRSQVRRAQRAYRTRKESTITTLDKRVKELEGLLSQVDKSCNDLNESLQSTRRNNVDVSTNNIAQQHVVEMRRLLDTALPRNSLRSTELRQLRKPILKPRIDPELSMSIVSDDTSPNAISALDDVEFPDLPELLPDIISSDNDTSTQSSGDPISIYDISFNLPLPLSMTSVRTFSHQERSLSRRLHRMCLERAVQYLTEPGIDERQLYAAFRLAYSISNKGRMLSRLRCMLHRGVNESLNNWAIPFFTIGGAGSFARWKKANSTPMIVDDLIEYKTACGPYAMPEAEADNFSNHNNLTDMLESIGFGGAWYDVNDVENCLRANGIEIRAQDSFVSFDVSCLHAVKQDVLTLNTIHGPQNPDMAYDPQFAIIPTDGDNEKAVVGDWKATSAAVMWPAINEKTAEPCEVPSRLILDVDRFMYLLVEQASCLGSAPGFRLAGFWNALLSSTH